MNIFAALILWALGTTTFVGLAVLVTIFARNRGRHVDLVSEEPELPCEVTENPYQPSRLQVTVKYYSRPYSSGERMVGVGGTAFVGLAFVTIIFLAWFAGG